MSDLEERILAHQRVLQALIAYMAHADRRFIDDLRERFVEPMNTGRRKLHYRDSDDFAEEFIRAVMPMSDAHAPRPWQPEISVEQPRSSKGSGSPRLSNIRHARPERVQVGQRNGNWAVRVDGVIRGDYHQKEHARAAAALLKLFLR